MPFPLMPTPVCEAAAFAVPLNVLSGLLFTLVAASIARTWRAQLSKDQVVTALVAIVAMIGAALAVAHFWRGPWLATLAAGSAGFFGLGYAALALHRFLGVSRTMAVAGALVIGATALLAHVAVPSSVLAGGAGYIPVVAGLYVLGAALVVQARIALHENDRLTGAAAARSDSIYLPKVRTGYALMQAGIVLSLALAFRAFDLPLCRSIGGGLHALWHALAALAVLVLLVAAVRHPSPEAAG